MTQDDRYHFNVIRRAIDMIDASPAALSLDELSAGMGMSPTHFQRVFSRWVGVSPKRYQQYLALGQAKALLRDRFTTLATADAVGLSGGGRLHDLFLNLGSHEPGRVRAWRGADLTINQGWFDSPFGPALVMGTERGICAIGFGSETTEDEADARSARPLARGHLCGQPHRAGALGGCGLRSEP